MPSWTEKPASSQGQAWSKSISSRRFSAPLEASDSDSDNDSVGPTPSFSMQVPESSTDESDDEVTSKPLEAQIAVLKTSRRVTPEQEAIHSLQSNFKVQLMLSARRKAGSFHALLGQIDAEEQQHRSCIKAAFAERERVEAKALRAQFAEQSAQHQGLLSSLEQQHKVQAEARERQIQAAETLAQEQEDLRRKEEAKREAAAARAEAVSLEKQEQERKAEEAAEKERQATRQKEEACQAALASQHKPDIGAGVSASLEALDANRRASSSPKQASTSGRTAAVRITPEAARFEAECKAVWQQQEAARKRLLADKTKDKAERRNLQKAIGKLVVSIASDYNQVLKASQSLLQLLSGLAEEERAFAFIQLAQTLLDSAEKATSPFPLAETAAAVGNEHPVFVSLLVAALHQVCPLSVPKIYVRLKQETQDEYLERWGFQRVTKFDKAAKKMVESWESLDLFLARSSAHIQFYAAFTQSDQQRQHGMSAAWSYLSRLLNLAKANCYTASALTAFVEIAGYRLVTVFRRQAMKLLEYIWFVFLAELQAPDLRQADTATVTSIKWLTQYLQDQTFQHEPAGRKLEMQNFSDHTV